MTWRTNSRETTWRRVGRAHVLGGLELAHLRFDQPSLPRTLRDTWTIAVAEGAPHHVWVRGRVRRVEPGSIILLPPNEVFGAEQIGYLAWGYRAIYPTTEQMAVCLPGFAAGIREPTRLAQPLVHDPVAAEALRELHQRFVAQSMCGECSATEADALERTLCRLIQTIVNSHSAIDGSVAKVHDAALRARAYIHEHCTSNLRVSDIAAHVGLSSYHFIRVFHEATGLPPYTYLDHVRVARARQLLAAGFPISEVAFLTGYSDQPHLTRHFKRAFGITPGAYCRASRGQSPSFGARSLL